MDAPSTVNLTEIPIKNPVALLWFILAIALLFLALYFGKRIAGYVSNLVSKKVENGQGTVLPAIITEDNAIF